MFSTLSRCAERSKPSVDQPISASAQADWTELNFDCYKVAYYWVRKWSRIYRVRPSSDWAADAVATAYCGYCRWRQKRIVHNPGGAISLFVRNAARSVVANQVRQLRRNGYTEQATDIELRETLDTTTSSGPLLRLLDKLPPKLAVVAAAAAHVVDANKYAIADLAGCSESTVKARLKALQSHPAIAEIAANL